MKSDIVNWARVEKLSNTLWQNLDKTTTKFHSISTISRGGLVPA